MKKFVLVLLSIAAATVSVMANPVNNSSMGAEILEVSDGIPFDPSLPFIPGPIEPQGDPACIDVDVHVDNWDGYYIMIDFNDGDRMSLIELENLNTGEKLNINHQCYGPVAIFVNLIEGTWKLLVKDRQGVSYYARFSVDFVTLRVERWY